MQTIILSLAFFLLGTVPANIDHPTIRIDWVEDLKGNYSFANNYSIKCEARCYEWAGTKTIIAVQRQDTVHCYTLCNAATHCSLHLDIVNNSCTATIVLNSIVAGGDKIYEYESGYIRIDKQLWKRKILKAEFDINFKNDEGKTAPIFWKGKIFARIK